MGQSWPAVGGRHRHVRAAANRTRKGGRVASLSARCGEYGKGSEKPAEPGREVPRDCAPSLLLTGMRARPLLVRRDRRGCWTVWVTLWSWRTRLAFR